MPIERATGRDTGVENELPVGGLEVNSGAAAEPVGAVHDEPRTAPMVFAARTRNAGVGPGWTPARAIVPPAEANHPIRAADMAMAAWGANGGRLPRLMTRAEDAVPGPQDVSTMATDSRDAHMHPVGYATSAVMDLRGPVDSLRKLLDHMDRAGAAVTTLMPIPTQMRGPAARQVRERYQEVARRPEGMAPGYYAPQLVRTREVALTGCHVEQAAAYEQMYWDRDPEMIHALSKLPAQDRARFVLMLTGFDPAADGCSEQFERKLHWAASEGIAVAGCGELTLHKELVGGQVRFDPELAVEPGTPFMELLRTCGRAGKGKSVATVHCDIDPLEQQIPPDASGVAPDAGLHGDGYRWIMEKLCAEVARWPEDEQPHIVWAHAGGFGKYVGAPADHAQKLRAMLDRYPKLSLDLSWDVVAKAISGDTDMCRAMAGLINAYPGRFFMGSDSLVPFGAQSLSATMGVYLGTGLGPETAQHVPDALFSRLDPQAVHAITSGNFQRVFEEGARELHDHAMTALPAKWAAMQEARERRGGHPNAWVEGFGMPDACGVPFYDTPQHRETEAQARREENAAVAAALAAVPHPVAWPQRDRVQPLQDAARPTDAGCFLPASAQSRELTALDLAAHPRAFIVDEGRSVRIVDGLACVAPQHAADVAAPAGTRLVAHGPRVWTVEGPDGLLGSSGPASAMSSPAVTPLPAMRAPLFHAIHDQTSPVSDRDCASPPPSTPAMRHVDTSGSGLDLSVSMGQMTHSSATETPASNRGGPSRGSGADLRPAGPRM